MLEKNKEICHNCGAPMVHHKHRLTPGLVEVFKKFVSAVKQKGLNDIHLQTELELSNNEYNNFQKLRYFGLVHHADKDQTRNGHWLVTRLGGEFIRCERPVKAWVVTYRNRIDENYPCEEYVWILDFYKNTDKDYWQKEFNFDVSQGRLI